MKRFTETTKWDDPWFWSLTFTAKLLWLYLLDNCDNSGTIDFNPSIAGFKIGHPIEEAHLSELQSRLQRLNSGKLWIPKFIPYQYGSLSAKCVPHLRVQELLRSHGITYPSTATNATTLPTTLVTTLVTTPRATLKEKDKDQEREKDQDFPTKIRLINEWYATQLAHEPHMDSGVEVLWARWFQAGFVEDDFKRVFKFKHANVTERHDHPGCLRLSNILEPDRFREDLMLAKQGFKNGKPTHQPRPNPRLEGVSRNNAVNDYAAAAKRKLERQVAEASNGAPPKAEGA